MCHTHYEATATEAMAGKKHLQMPKRQLCPYQLSKAFISQGCG